MIVQRKYINRKGLNEIISISPVLATALAALDTTTDLGQRISAGLSWLFTEDKLQVVPISQILNECEENEGSYEDTCEMWGVPCLMFTADEDNLTPSLGDQRRPEGLDVLKSGDTFNYQGVNLMVIKDFGPNDWMYAAPAEWVAAGC